MVDDRVIANIDSTVVVRQIHGLAIRHGFVTEEAGGCDTQFVTIHKSVELNTVDGHDWLILGRITGQVSSERLLFSETLGLGGFETLRGFDERASNADQGWIANIEFGPKTLRWGCEDDPRTLRPYTFMDLGNGYLSDPLPGEDAYTFVASTGVGFRYTMSDRLSARFDWGYGFEDFGSGSRNNRLHFGVTWIPGRRP